jgi:hypothetical protein
MGCNILKKPPNSAWHQVQAEEVVCLLDMDWETGLAAVR